MEKISLNDHVQNLPYMTHDENSFRKQPNFARISQIFYNFYYYYFYYYYFYRYTTKCSIATSILFPDQICYSWLSLHPEIIPILTSTPNEFVTHRYLKQKHQSHLFCYNRIVRVFDLILLPFFVSVGT